MTHKRTKPEDIGDVTYKKIWAKLQELQYPCTIVVYGPSRTENFSFRTERSEVFKIDHCDVAMDAWNIVDCGYCGDPEALCIYSVDGLLKELFSV